MNKTDRFALVLALAGLLLMLAVNHWLSARPSAAQQPEMLAQRDGYVLSAVQLLSPGETHAYPMSALSQGTLLYVGEEKPLSPDLPAQQARDVRSLVGRYLNAAEHVALAEEAIYALCSLVREHPMRQILIAEGMRSPWEQAALQAAVFAEYQSTMPVRQALQQAAADVPDTGKSEHQLAFAFDVQLTGALDWSQPDPMARSEEGQWLLENGWHYGFIRRYPPERIDLTGVTNEALHWRYVGAAHAAALHTADWCLEEYLQALHAYGTLCLQDPQGRQTWLCCVPLEGEQAFFPVPAGWQVLSVSADNLGYAVAVMKEADQSS